MNNSTSPAYDMALDYALEEANRIIEYENNKYHLGPISPTLLTKSPCKIARTQSVETSQVSPVLCENASSEQTVVCQKDASVGLSPNLALSTGTLTDNVNTRMDDSQEQTDPLHFCIDSTQTFPSDGSATQNRGVQCSHPGLRHIEEWEPIEPFV